MWISCAWWCAFSSPCFPDHFPCFSCASPRYSISVCLSLSLSHAKDSYHDVVFPHLAFILQTPAGKPMEALHL
jgi:hypothetical protein